MVFPPLTWVLLIVAAALCAIGFIKFVWFMSVGYGLAVGGIGVAEFPGFPGCCELQKLYLDRSARGRGLGYEMIRHIEAQAKAMGYRRIYLETHTNLEAAMHEYERSG